jgi:hypothetical protein
MNSIAQRLGLYQLRPLTIWYLVCLSLDDQFEQCREHIAHDFGDEAAASPAAAARLLEHERVVRSFAKPLVQHTIPVDDGRDYTCLITLKDTSRSGGFAFKSHTRPMAVEHRLCRPTQVLSAKGHAKLLALERDCCCPICHTVLGEDDFVQVGPKPEPYVAGSIFSPGLDRVFYHLPPPSSFMRGTSALTAPTSQTI